MNVVDYVKYVDNEMKVNGRERENNLFMLVPTVIFVYSSLYKDPIFVDGNDFVEGRFDTTKYGVREDFFEHPFYVSVHCNDSIEKMGVIDSIPGYIPMVINADERFVREDRIDNICYCPYADWVDLDLLYDRYIKGDLLLTEENSPVVEIRNIDDDTLNKLNELKKYSGNSGEKFRYRMSISDGKSLSRVHEVIDHLEEEVFICIHDEIFKDGSGRDLLRNSSEFEANIAGIKKKYVIDYNGVVYNDFKHLIDLEKSVDVVISRIPKGASDLDKTVFMTLFMVNHFQYDYENVDKMRDLFEFIKDRKGVCRDYAALAEYLFNRAGVECSKTSNYKDAENGHAFNIVYIDGKKTLLDITWLAEEVKAFSIVSIVQSNNFLTDEKTFGHDGYLDERHEDSVMIDRAEVVKSLLKVRNWKYTYYISKDMLVDLFKKGPKKKSEMEKSLENSMPGYSI